MLPVRRDIRFELPAHRIKDWHEQGSPVTHFFNALSLLFPAGERFFMDSVRHYRARIDDPDLAAQVQGFIGQEAMHSREHVRYNDLMEDAGLPARKLDRRLAWLLDLQKKWLPASFNLAVTLALEHYTAILADLLLRDPSRLGNSVPGYMHVWTWHALEETEHKSVSYDVWNRVITPGPLRYLLRCGTMLITSLLFWFVVFDFHVRLLIADRRTPHRARGLWRLVVFLYGPRGVFPNIARQWLDYFRPGFHPWQHDNSTYLQRIDGLVAAIEAGGHP